MRRKNIYKFNRLMNNLGFELVWFFGDKKRIELFWDKDDSCRVCCFVHRKSRRINNIVVNHQCSFNDYTSYKQFSKNQYIQRLNRQNKLRSIISKINS